MLQHGAHTNAITRAGESALMAVACLQGACLQGFITPAIGTLQPMNREELEEVDLTWLRLGIQIPEALEQSAVDRCSSWARPAINGAAEDQIHSRVS